MLRIPIITAIASLSAGGFVLATGSLETIAAAVGLAITVLGAARSITKSVRDNTRKYELALKTLQWLPCWPKRNGKPLTLEEIDALGPNVHFQRDTCEQCADET